MQGCGAKDMLTACVCTSVTTCSVLLAVQLLLLLDDAQADTLALGQRDERLVALSDHKHVLQPASNLQSAHLASLFPADSPPFLKVP